MPAKNKLRYNVNGIKAVVAKVQTLAVNGENVRDKLNSIVRKLGGCIDVASSDTDESLHVREGGFTIYISPVTSPRRDNFTIAHELGHLLLHTQHDECPEATVAFGRHGAGVAEVEANRFAAELLMPEEEFRKKARACGNDPYTLAMAFDVSVAAASVRIESLHLADNHVSDI